MPAYLHPGTFIEEQSTGSKPIQGVGTTTASFVCVTEKGPVGQAVLITNWTQFVKTFGGYIPEGYGAYAVFSFFNNGGRACYVVRVAHYEDITDPDTLTALIASHSFIDRSVDYPAATLKVEAVSPGAWGNDLKIVITDDPLGNTTPSANIAIGAEQAVLTSVNGFKENSVVCFNNGTQKEYKKITEVVKATKTIKWTGGLAHAYPSASSTVKTMEFRISVVIANVEKERWVNLTMVDGEERYVETIVNDPTGGSTFIKVTDLDDPAGVGVEVPTVATATLTGGDDGLTDLSDIDFIGDPSARNGIYALDAIDDVNMVSVPGGTSSAIINAGLSYCEVRMDCFFIADSPLNLTPLQALQFRNDTGNFNSSYGALYYPWIEVSDPIGYGKNPTKQIPPCGAVAGIYAKTDMTIGIEKAPAGEETALNGVLGLDYNVNDSEQDILNPAGVNCIRSFSGRGIVVWGARTLSSDPEWRYVNQRRSMMFLEESIIKGTRWSVFQVNDPILWRKLTVNLTAFLTSQWREGVLYGRSAAEAFYVKCDEETNPSETRDEGKCITEIGVALQKPAEFVIFRIGQWKSGASLEE